MDALSRHTLICRTAEVTFELTYRSKDSPKEGIPVAQAVRAVLTHDRYCKEKNISPSLDMTITVKEEDARI